MSDILTAMVIAQYENDLIEYGKMDVLDPDVHALSWADLSDEEQNLRKKSMAAALRKAAEIMYDSGTRMQVLASAELIKIAEQAND